MNDNTIVLNNFKAEYSADYLFWYSLKKLLEAHNKVLETPGFNEKDIPESIILRVKQDISDPNIVFLLEDAPNDYQPHVYLNKIQDKIRAGQEELLSYSDFLFQEPVDMYRCLIVRASANYLLGDNSLHKIKVVIDGWENIAQILHMSLISPSPHLKVEVENPATANIALQLMIAKEASRGQWVSPSQKKEYALENMVVPGFYQVVERQSRDGQLLTSPAWRSLIYVENIDNSGIHGVEISEPFSTAERKRIFDSAPNDLKHLYRDILTPSHDYPKADFSFIDTGIFGLSNVEEDQYLLSRLEGVSERLVSYFRDGEEVFEEHDFTASQFVYWCLTEQDSGLNLDFLDSSKWDELRR